MEEKLQQLKELVLQLMADERLCQEWASTMLTATPAAVPDYSTVSMALPEAPGNSPFTER